MLFCHRYHHAGSRDIYIITFIYSTAMGCIYICLLFFVSNLFCMYFIPLVTSSKPSPCPIHPKRERATPIPQIQTKTISKKKKKKKKKTPWKITIYKKKIGKSPKTRKRPTVSLSTSPKRCNPIRSIYICCMRVASCLFEPKIAKKETGPETRKKKRKKNEKRKAI
ncbi:hypothetical protein BZA77DRAFT_108347 [Pyronema omphalodes]|nr:hypothetical protein BZA77DRAFT_108347 [Pyronema omphalodes]